MSKGEGKGLVPELRFPEFRNAGEWEGKPLKKAADILMGSSPKSSAYNENSEGLPLLQGNADIRNRLSAPRIFTTQITKECFPGDILLSVRAPVGTVAKSKHHACIGRGIAAISAKSPNSQEYLYQWFISFEHQWQNISQGGMFDAVNSDDIKLLKAGFPKPAEQQKIADCLTSIDELVTSETQKLDSLKAHKKGLMQQLFPVEGETQPKLRFPEFRGKGEWNIETIDDISTISSGGTPSRAKPEYWDGNIPWVSTTLIDFNTIQAANEHITELGLQNSSAKILPKGTILMAMYGQGKTRGQVAMLGIAASINQACAAITLKEGMNTEFVFQNLASRYDEIRQISNQGGQENLSAMLIKKIPLSYPDIDSGEQQKIADCLTSIDELITAQTQKIDALNDHKKGLMQQLFPAMDEADR